MLYVLLLYCLVEAEASAHESPIRVYNVPDEALPLRSRRQQWSVLRAVRCRRHRLGTKFRDLLLAVHFSQVLTCRLVNRQLGGYPSRIAHADWPVILPSIVSIIRRFNRQCDLLMQALQWRGKTVVFSRYSLPCPVCDLD